MFNNSITWFENFLANQGEAQDNKEVDFITRQLPIQEIKSILDIGCGSGRHANKLAGLGYKVTGIDNNENLINHAKSLSSDVKYLLNDMRKLEAVTGNFDGIICMWSSFGYFDSATNKGILEKIHTKLNKNGKLILDIHNPAFFEKYQGIHVIEKNENLIKETVKIKENRLFVELNYGKDMEFFNWELFTIEKLNEIAEGIGFSINQYCSCFEEGHNPTEDNPRIQIVLQKK